MSFTFAYNRQGIITPSLSDLVELGILEKPISDFTDEDIAAIKKLDGVQYASMQSMSMCQMTANDLSGILMGIGCNTDMQMIMQSFQKT